MIVERKLYRGVDLESYARLKDCVVVLHQKLVERANMDDGLHL
jgi:hypothetical protein